MCPCQVRVDVNRLLPFGNGCVEFALLSVGNSQIGMRLCQVGVNSNRLFEFCNGIVEFALLSVGKKIPAKSDIMVTTTINSTSVKPLLLAIYTHRPDKSPTSVTSRLRSEPESEL